MSEDNLTFEDIYTRVQEKINNTNSTMLGYLKKWINDRYFEVMNSEEWPFARSTTVGTLAFSSGTGWKVALPTDFDEEEEDGIYDTTNNRVLDYAEKADVRWEDVDASSSTSGPTHYFFPYDGYIGIYPRLASGNLSVSIEYYKKLTALSAIGDISLIPNQWRVATLVNGTIADYLNAMKHYNEASMYEVKFQRAIRQMGIEQGLYDSRGNEDVRIEWDKGVKE